MNKENITDDFFNIEMELFQSKAELTEYLILKHLSHKTEPVGSWVLQTMLAQHQIKASTATIGRMLKTLDSRNLTRLIESQGRVLTEEGQTYIDHLTEELERMRYHKQLISAAQPHDIQELIDLLKARKALECEGAYLAALRRTPEHIEELKNLLKLHEQCVSEQMDPTFHAFDFHRKISEASQNRFIIAAVDILIFENQKLEGSFKNLVTRNRGCDYGVHHHAIVEAIVEQDSEEAAKLMSQHMEALIEDIEQQRQTVK
ncbi:FCD domain-containing protein [Brevibacillus sp. B_LB10_24]|uniref:FCD domain-containing protein n=1 Tax=Brevibacillus sp. B_LB10_24 TaxID=3380645 RepID=UPI0038BB5004